MVRQAVLVDAVLAALTFAPSDLAAGDAGRQALAEMRRVRALVPRPDLCAYRVAQESLTNILKHAGPATARIELDYGGCRSPRTDRDSHTRRRRPGADPRWAGGPVHRRVGLEVVGEAADGADAVELAAETHPDVNLTDIRMPVLDGIAATQRGHRQDARVEKMPDDDTARMGAPESVPVR